VNFADAYVDARAYVQSFNVYERAISLAELNGLSGKQRADVLRKYLKGAEQARSPNQTNNHFERDRYGRTAAAVCNRLRRITDADRSPWAMPECGAGPLQ
jgi:hypothetical protein